MKEFIISTDSTADLPQDYIKEHNLFIHHLKIKIKFLGLDIEVKSKEKSAPSRKD